MGLVSSRLIWQLQKPGEMRYLITTLLRAFLVIVCCSSLTLWASAQGRKPSRVDVSLVTDEAEAVLAVLAKKRANEPVIQADWNRIFSSQGYVRLKQREASMKRSFEETDFQKFVLSDELARRAELLAETLGRWKNADVTTSARLALAYLPKEARIRAKIYPVIKPRDNSFVFDVKNDPAIFLYLDPTVGREKFENTLAHELHHIGYGSSCPTQQTSEAIARLGPNTRTVLQWIGAFGEGFAMLAAAGGPNLHPHAVSPLNERARWDRDMMNFNSDLKRVETFFLGILEGRLSAEEVQKDGFAFFGIQGPWYTVGWKMSVLIEKSYGRQKLIECMCDPRRLLPTFNQAALKYNRKAHEPLASWSGVVLNSFSPLAPLTRPSDHLIPGKTLTQSQGREGWLAPADSPKRSLNPRQGSHPISRLGRVACPR